MTQPSSVRFVMEDRYAADKSSFQLAIETDQAAFETTINNKVAGMNNPNALINGAMDVWQRGTSSTATSAYGSADRWYQTSSAGVTTFAKESAIVPGCAQNAMKITQATADGIALIRQVIETSNAVSFAGGNATLSAYFAATTSVSVLMKLYYSTTVDTAVGGAWTEITATSYTGTDPTGLSYGRISGVFAVPATAKSLLVVIGTLTNLTVGNSLYVSGIKLEAGNLVSAFTRNGGSTQAELAACQRYYYRNIPAVTGARYGIGQTVSATAANFSINFPVTMRTRPTALEQSGTAAHYSITNAAGGVVACSAVPALQSSTENMATITANSTYTAAGQASYLSQNNVLGYLGFSAEL